MSGITIRTNVPALQAQRRLSESSDALSKTCERLSSGLRINRASDDAAGLAIADSLRTDARLYGSAIRNINDAVSFTNILEGTVSAQQDILSRLSELAEQAANGTYSDQQRGALNDEYQALVQEFGRIAGAAEFNGQPLLQANGAALQIQAGITGDARSILTITSPNTLAFSGTVETTGDLDGNGVVNVLDYGLGFAPVITGPPITFSQLERLSNGVLSKQSITASDGTQHSIYVMAGLLGYGGAWNSAYFAAFDALANGQFDPAGASNAVSVTGNVSLDLAFASGATATLTLDLSASRWIRQPTTLPSYITTSAARSGQYVQQASNINFTGVETVLRARDAIETLDNRRAELAAVIGEIGALQSRLRTAGNIAAITRENSMAAGSRIRDADMAGETAQLIRSAILQQAGAAVLAQANQQPAIALQLLSG